MESVKTCAPARLDLAPAQAAPPGRIAAAPRDGYVVAEVKPGAFIGVVRDGRHRITWRSLVMPSYGGAEQLAWAHLTALLDGRLHDSRR